MTEKVIDYDKLNALMEALEEWNGETLSEVSTEDMLLLICKLLQFTVKEND